VVAVFSRGSPCGSFNGYALWNSPERNCWPNLRESFAFLINRRLQAFLDSYPPKTHVSEDLDGLEFDFYFRGKKVIGSSKTPSFIVFRGLIYFSVDPSFFVDSGYDIEEFEDVRRDAQVLVHRCRVVDDLDACLEEEMNSPWRLGPCEGSASASGRLRRFCVPSESLLNYLGREFRVEHQFALDFSVA